MPKKKAITPKALGLVPGTKLSTRYANDKNNYKIVEDRVLGFMVFGDDRNGYQITKMLDASIYTKRGRTLHITQSWEYGDTLVSRPDHLDGMHDSYIASAVVQLLAVLQERAYRRK
jgi:hypothetical protein